MNQIKKLTMRNTSSLEYFKSIRFKVEFPKKISGTLIYIREHYLGYDLNTGDSIDSSLQSFLESSFGGVTAGYQTILIVEEQLQNALKITRGGVEKNVIFYFMPHPTYELFEKRQYDGGIKAIAKELRITLMTTDNESINQAIQNEYITYIDEDSLRRVNTIKKI